MATTSLRTLYEYIVDTYGLGRRGINTGTGTTSITSDAYFGGPGAAEGIEVGCQVIISKDAGGAGAAPEGEISNLSSAPKETTGVFNIDPAVTALASTDEFIVLYRPLRWAGGGVGVFDRFNESLREFTWEKRLVPVTLVTDGDMLLRSDLSVWNVTALNATRAKVVATHPLGERVLRVTATADGGYTENTALIPVEAGASYYFEATASIASTGAAADAGTLILWDQTNGSAITLDNSAVSRFEPTRLINNVTMPSGCEQVSVRLKCTLNGDIIDWSNIILRKNETRQHVLADRPQRVMRLGKVKVAPQKDWSAQPWNDMTEIAADDVQLDGGLWRLDTRASTAGRALWYEEFVALPALVTTTGLTDTTNVPREWLCAVTAEKLLEPLQVRSEEWALRYKKAARNAAGVIAAYQQLHTVRDNTVKAYALPFV